MPTPNEDMTALAALLEQWKKTAEQLSAQTMAPALEAQKELLKSLESLNETPKILAREFSAPITDMRNRLLESAEAMKMSLPDLSPFSQQIEEFQVNLQNLISSTFEKLQESFRELPAPTQETLLLLGNNGWYLDLEMPISGLWELRTALLAGDIEEAEIALAEYFGDRLDEIEISITSRFPHRAHIIGAAFSAHRSREYILSVPVLLAQTDGICKDAAGEYLFLRNRGSSSPRPSIASYVEQVAADTYRAAILSPLTQILPISYSERERSEDFNALNRHMILHGESLDYGTEINSFKAVSLVNYVAHVLETKREEP